MSDQDKVVKDNDVLEEEEAAPNLEEIDANPDEIVEDDEIDTLDIEISEEDEEASDDADLINDDDDDDSLEQFNGLLPDDETEAESEDTF